jgi:hypothetical protein
MPKKDHINRCNICNKDYSSYNTLWVHNKKFHNPMIILDNTFTNFDNTLIIPKKIYNCRTCNKQFNKFQNRWKHEKICKNKYNNTNQEINNTINKNNNNIINNKINNNIINKTVKKIFLI